MNKSCLTLNSLQNTTQLAVNSTADPIDVLAAFFPPLLTYADWVITENNNSILFYQFCGPLVVLMKTFAKFVNKE